MIRRLHIQGWRAFEEVTLELADGLTFVIAENGVGKTSLVQAAAWGLYGALSRVDARAARRIGSPLTRVTVELELPDGRTLEIEREVQDRSESMRAHVGGRSLDEGDVAQVMAQTFGASREFLSMTTLLPSDTVVDDGAGAFQLQAHLRRVFGVDDLQHAAHAVQAMHDEAQAQARRVRQATRRAAQDLTRLRGKLAEAEAAQANAAAARSAARQVLDFAEGQLRQARANEAARAKAWVARQQLAELLTEARTTIGRNGAGTRSGAPSGTRLGAPSGTRSGARLGARLAKVTESAELVALLETAELAASDAVDEHRRDAATVAGQLAAVRAAASALHAAGAECPVCRRDLSDEDVVRAQASHQQEIRALEANERVLNEKAQAAQELLGQLRTLSRRAVRLPEISLATDDDVGGVDLEAATFAVQAARADVDRAEEDAATARATWAALAAAVSDEERLIRETQQAHEAHQREAVTRVAEQVIRGTADAILAERIDPLAAEVSHRWKRVFGERGSLRLQPDGHLVLVRGVHEIPFAQFSSGEKVVALLATRLLVLGASTRASFIWLDEPLEHLDPKNRRITASLMSAAGEHVRQILVTTYEEGLARRLASVASAQLRYVRTPEE